MPRLSLGLDSSTQKLQAIVIDIDSGKKVFDKSLDYRSDPRLNKFGITEDYILPPRHPGEADQPPQMYFASLDAMFSDIRDAINPADIVVINTSGQQHGHVYLNDVAHMLFERLRDPKRREGNLADLLSSSLAYDRAPIWMTSDTIVEADEIRQEVGGKQKMIELSGSDSPLRFTGAKIRKIGKEDWRTYSQTERIQLIGNLIPAVLTGNPDVPCDFANACGMSMMDYRKKEWSPELLEAVVKEFGAGENCHLLFQRLPRLAPPDSIVGEIAEYFVSKYGFNKDCKIVAGSGDNPESKVLVAGDLLSLGTSFVNMTSTDGQTFDLEGFANAMYDGVGRPFIFGCRTNGAMVWDKVRADHGIPKEDYVPGERALTLARPGSERMFFFQPKNESFPVSGTIPITRIGNEIGSLASDYNGIIESSLAAVFIHSRGFTKQTSDPLYVTGGATDSPEIMRRVAAIWNRPVIPTEKGGAALGAAVAGVQAYLGLSSKPSSLDNLCQVVLPRKNPINPNPEDVSAYHGENGYLQRFVEQEARLIGENPIK